MGCDTGQGAFLSMTLETAFDCTDEGSNFNDTVELVLPIPQLRVNITNQLRVREFSNWEVSQDVFDAARVDDPCGVFRRKRFGCDRDHGEWTALFEWPTAKNPETPESRPVYNTTLLVGAEGIFRRTSNDGSYWEGRGRIIRCDGLPTESGEEKMGTLAVQWKGGIRNGELDPKYVGPPSAGS